MLLCYRKFQINLCSYIQTHVRTYMANNREKSYEITGRNMQQFKYKHIIQILTVSDSLFLPLVTNANPCVSMATPVFKT